MIRIYLPSLADELDRADPRTSSLTMVRSCWRDESLARARERRAELRAIRGLRVELRVLSGGKS